MTLEAHQVPLLIHKIAELGIAVGAAPINKFPDCWEHQIDERWFLAFNWHDEPRSIERYGVKHEIPGRLCYLEYNGWPAGLIGFDGGPMAAGACANEDTLIEAIDTALQSLREAGTQESEGEQG